MAPRAAQRKARENDYSNVGKAGRRTGVTVPEGRRDEFGLEEITGIFSSPQKALQNAPFVESTLEVSEEMVGMDSTGQAPSTVLSTRKSLRGPSLPRSASPRKTGITGIARRSDGFDLSPAKRMTIGEDRENTPTYPTPIPINGNITRRFSPEKSPLKEMTTNPSISSGTRSLRKGKQRQSYQEAIIYDQEDNGEDYQIDPSLQEQGIAYEEDNVYGVNDDDSADEYVPQDEVAQSVEKNDLGNQLQSDAYQEDHSSPARAKGNRKRKSDDLESVQPNTKKARTTGSKKQKIREDSAIYMDSAESGVSHGTVAQPTKKGRTVGARKDPNIPMSSRQQKELDDVVERIRARPGKPKSLYILRRETPTDDSATYTRSGRVSVKPLAYWRNERCVYGDSGEVPEGSRFPLSTIKEIIRTEEVETSMPSRKKGESKGKKDKKARHGLDDDEDEDGEGDGIDHDAEPWETETGVYKGDVSQWDQDLQRPLSSTYEMDIAYAPRAIETREVRNATFRYAKLLSTPFFGSGIVDLPPSGEKREKNSRKMHMCFYVFEGRVTVTVAGNNRISIGKGGMWQVPRGNLYSIENRTQRPARIFFSQGCVTNLDEEVGGGGDDGAA